MQLLHIFLLYTSYLYYFTIRNDSVRLVILRFKEGLLGLIAGVAERPEVDGFILGIVEVTLSDEDDEMAPYLI